MAAGTRYSRQGIDQDNESAWRPKAAPPRLLGKADAEATVIPRFIYVLNDTNTKQRVVAMGHGG